MDPTVFFDMSYGVYVVSAYDAENGRSTGCTANAVMQVTAEPETVAVSINHVNHTHACIEKEGKFAVSILAETSKPLIIGTFGFRSGQGFRQIRGIRRARGRWHQSAQRCVRLLCLRSCAKDGDRYAHRVFGQSDRWRTPAKGRTHDICLLSQCH